MPYEKVEEEFGQVNCNLDRLVELFSKQRYTKWNKLYDYALSMGQEHEMYRDVEKAFSYNEIEERKKFLGEEALHQLRLSTK